MIGYVNGKFIGDIESIVIYRQINIGDKLKASFNCPDGIMGCTGFVTKIDHESYWLNEIRFPMDSCFFERVI